MNAGLLDRAAFREAVLTRSNGQCVFCGAPAADAHHILERKLFPDGGYYRDNGAAVCAPCHWQCETTAKSPEDVRRAAGIAVEVLPPGWPSGFYDKWGNRVRSDGSRTWGPLSGDSGARKALAQGGFLGRFRPDIESFDPPR